MDDSGPALLNLRERGCVELLAVLELPEGERTTLMSVGGLYASVRGQALAELLADVARGGRLTNSSSGPGRTACRRAPSR